MKVLAEVFRGIEFIRISNLPEEQKEFIKKSIPSDKIINILKDKMVIRDCIQYHDYLALYTQYKVRPVIKENKQPVSQERKTNYKLAFK